MEATNSNIRILINFSLKNIIVAYTYKKEQYLPKHIKLRCQKFRFSVS